MTNKILSAFICLISFVGRPPGSRASTSTELVKVEGLKPAYASCGQVSLSIKNVSQQDLYLEIYAERLTSGSWDYEDYPYDLKDPKSRYVKRVIVNPETVKPGASLPLTYDRCQRPLFVKETDLQYQKAIIERDLKSAPLALQRFRVQVYTISEGHVKFAMSIFSEPFKRTGGWRTRSESPKNE